MSVNTQLNAENPADGRSGSNGGLGLLDQLREEADLCRNETADDIAHLLDDAANEIERLRKDAERYRWLRGGPDVPPHSRRWPRWEVRNWDGRWWNTLFAEQMDAAVDAAMRDDKVPNAKLTRHAEGVSDAAKRSES